MNKDLQGILPTASEEKKDAGKIKWDCFIGWDHRNYTKQNQELTSDIPEKAHNCTIVQISRNSSNIPPIRSVITYTQKE